MAMQNTAWERELCLFMSVEPTFLFSLPSARDAMTSSGLATNLSVTPCTEERGGEGGRGEEEGGVVVGRRGGEREGREEQGEGRERQREGRGSGRGGVEEAQVPTSYSQADGGRDYGLTLTKGTLKLSSWILRFTLVTEGGMEGEERRGRGGGGEGEGEEWKAGGRWVEGSRG